MIFAHLECFSGVSGDMLLGAFVDAGLPLARLRSELKKMPLSGYTLRREKVQRAGISATRIHVGTKGTAPLRRWNDVRRIIQSSSLHKDVKSDALSIMGNLFDAEATVHGTTRAKAHLHELGAVDCLVDVVGAAVALHVLGIAEVTTSAINTGGGEIKTEHGILPVPAPATALLLRSLPVFSDTDRHELTTPTGAAILSTVARGSGVLPEMRLRTVGRGAGSLDPDHRPNIVSLLIGEREEPVTDETVHLIETNIDDMDPRIFEHVMERLLAEGALDVFLTPVLMKKSRPAARLSVLARPGDVEALSRIVLAETTSFGVRIYGVGRRILDRRMEGVTTPYGPIRVKVGSLEGRIVTRMPEYEDCRRAAKKHGVPIQRVIKAAGKGRGKESRGPGADGKGSGERR